MIQIIFIFDDRFFRELTDINTLAQLREKTEEQLNEDLLPFGFIDTGDDINQEGGWQSVPGRAFEVQAQLFINKE